MRAELARRQSLEDRLFAFILAHPRRWLGWKELSQHGGSAWRSRLPGIRQRLADLDLEFPWNQQTGDASAYMLREKALGRQAHEYVSQVGLF